MELYLCTTPSGSRYLFAPQDVVYAFGVKRYLALASEEDLIAHPEYLAKTLQEGTTLYPEHIVDASSLLGKRLHLSGVPGSLHTNTYRDMVVTSPISEVSVVSLHDLLVAYTLPPV